jgi:hypothetical protein
MMKVVLYRGFGTNIDLLDGFVGQYEGKVVDLLENSESNVSLYECIHVEADLTRRKI